MRGGGFPVMSGLESGYEWTCLVWGGRYQWDEGDGDEEEEVGGIKFARTLASSCGNGVKRGGGGGILIV
jgi:hypothetical protein